tara:strand:- start:107 stop:892 length:786 start_codon:yes stop_codon:yes gene_type:complete
MANEGSTRMTPEELRAMARNARAPVMTTAELRLAIESGEKVASTGSRVESTRNSAQIAYDERMARNAKTAAFAAAQHTTAREQAEIRTVQLELERTTANAMANADIQKDRVFIVNSANTNPVTTKYLDQFAERASIAPKYFDPSIYVVHGVSENNNSPIIEESIVNYSGIGKNQTTEVSKPSNSTSTVQNNKNNASTTDVNKTNLIPNVNYLPVNTTELNKFATPNGVAPIVETKPDYSNIAIIGGAAAVLAGIVVIGSKR